MTDRLSDLYTKWATETPDAVAVDDGDLAVTYAEFATAVGDYRAQLEQRGVRTGSHVAIVADNSTAYLVAAYAVWSAGAVLVTVYSSSSAQEIAYAVDSAEAMLILCDARALTKLQQCAVPLLKISDDDVRQSLTTARAGDDRPEVTDDSLALICFTSGSTAAPKAVIHSRGSLVAAADAFIGVWHVDQRDRTIVSLPMAWIYGLVSAATTTLRAGGKVLVLARSKPELMVHAIEERGATFLPAVTTMFARLVEHLDETGKSVSANHLRLCISAGEPRNERVFDRWQALTGIPVHDSFAASECFPAITYDPEADPMPLPGCAGKVIPGAEMKLVDEHGDEVAPGAPGEAYWRGPALFVGYWKAPEATAKALTEDGWYRTQDLARVDEQGYVYVLGRLSDMIIRGGSNISPAEVEKVLADISGVRQVAVIGPSDEKYGQRVVAAIVAEPGVEERTLTEVATAHLATYKVPGEYVFVDELPENTKTGKLDRKATLAAYEKGELR